MVSVRDPRRAGAVLVVVGLLSACTTDTPPSAAPRGSTASPTMAAPPQSSSPSLSPQSSSTVNLPDGLAVPEPERAFDPATLLDAMRTSRRPGGVPDRLETDAIASALSDAIRVYGGQPWTTMAIGGSCGSQICTLEVAGTRSGNLGEDLWVFDVTPASGAVQLVSADLRSLPPDVSIQLDELARAMLPATNFEGLNLTNVRWLPPPDDAQFVLSYRSGEEEVSTCGLDITLDAVAPGIVSRLFLDC
ncbi:MAG: hypothetical protein ACT4OQ_01680 [Chloroflexota bacterium]